MIAPNPITIPAQNFPDEQSWLDSRPTFIGASESAAILGQGYQGQSPLTIWSGKTGGPQLPIEPATIRLMNRGKRMEPIIAAEFADETGLPVYDPGQWAVYRHPVHQWMGATLDRWTVHPDHGPIPCELKNIHGRFWREWEDDQEPPLKYLIQVQHQMAVTDTPACYLAAMVGGSDLVVRLIERESKFIALLIYRLAEFWELVRSRAMPQVDESDATRQILGMIYPRDTGTETTLPESATEWDRELTETKQRIKDLEAKATGLENNIRAAIGEAAIGRLPFGGSYQWKLVERKEYMVKATSYRMLRRSNK